MGPVRSVMSLTARVAASTVCRSRSTGTATTTTSARNAPAAIRAATSPADTCAPFLFDSPPTRRGDPVSVIRRGDLVLVTCRAFAVTRHCGPSLWMVRNGRSREEPVAGDVDPGGRDPTIPVARATIVTAGPKPTD